MIALAEPRPDPRQSLGRAGEAEAERFLTGIGMRVLDRRFRTRAGEIDLILIEGATVVFVEVKTRTTDRAGSPAEAVTPRKQRRIASVALTYLSRRGWQDRMSRFDVVEVRPRGTAGERVRHIPDAFRL